MRFNTSERVFICGMTGSGKSHFVKNALLPRIEKFVIYDKEAEYGDFGKVVNKIPPYKIVTEKEAGVTYMRYKFDERALVKSELHKAFDSNNHVVFQPRPGRHKRDFEPMTAFLLNYIRGITYVVDEMHLLAPTYKTPPKLEEYITGGRKRGLGFIGLTQRPALVSKTTIAQADHHLIFIVHGKDLEWVQRYVHKDITQCQEYYYYYATKNNPGILELNNPI